MLEMKERDGLGRICRFDANGKAMETPALLPVVNPHRPLIPPRAMAQVFRAEAIITNAYIISSGPLRQEALEAGVHRLLDFPGLVMTDSGAFQAHVYGREGTTNREVVEFQRAIGADIGTVLDLFSEPTHGRARAEGDLRETMARTREAAEEKGDMALAGAVQGGLFPDLREAAARELSSLPVDVHAIGGVVPLMEAYRFADLVDVLAASRRGLAPHRPVHLFGAGHPMLFPLAVLLGCDLFDSASYAKFARDGRMLFPDGTRRASDLAYLPCGCPTCSRSTVEEMAGSEVRRAEHNLHVSFSEVRRVKQAIHEGALWELAEERARSHPSLLEALRRLRRHGDLLEAHDNIGRSTFLYTGPEALLRPAVARFRRRVAERCRPPPGCTAVVLAPSQLPAPGAREALGRRLSAAGIHGIILSPLGPVPLELGHIYPVGQAVLPADLDPEAEAAANDLLREYLQVSQPAAALGPQEGALDDLLRTAKGGPPRDFAFALARATAEYQFGARGAEALFQGKVELVASRNTGRLRNVLVDGEHVLSLRAGDGLYTLRLPGARRLHAALPPPSLRVVVEADSVPFNRKGLNVFARFVREMDPDLRPGDEVLVTDAEDHLLAVGRTLVVRPEALALRRGMLVRVREGVERHAGEGR